MDLRGGGVRLLVPEPREDGFALAGPMAQGPLGLASPEIGGSGGHVADPSFAARAGRAENRKASRF